MTCLGLLFFASFQDILKLTTGGSGFSAHNDVEAKDRPFVGGAPPLIGGYWALPVFGSSRKTCKLHVGMECLPIHLP